MKGIFLLCILLTSIKSFAMNGESLIGKWCSHYDTSGKCSSIEHLYKDGTYFSHGTVDKWKLRYETRGTWEIKNDAACFTPKDYKYYHSETGKELTFDEERKSYCDKILNIKPNQITIEEHTNKTTMIIKRVFD